ncbi:unnamed protein product [Plutella xylostella]|uniref:(diamondback moth) hypothetical protein n=1 Tax=Plutella xylostella TaxID=51655 RepID=A0A8S4FZB1_PLUXY|nr:unnamed protein product [Plutella xylostella]
MFRSRSWFGGGWGRPKNPHSLERLKYLHNILCKNTTVSESNRGTLVESLRCIAEILIWGDQNDSSVFDFFLEKNMLSYFLKIMRQRCGGSSFVCVQLLQTLNILFENIRNETSLYYLLSNNHVNSIIVHKFDFSDEEVMAYYVSFLKTLSLKLNNHTIHFFYNEIKIQRSTMKRNKVPPDDATAHEPEDMPGTPDGTTSEDDPEEPDPEQASTQNDCLPISPTHQTPKHLKTNTRDSTPKSPSHKTPKCLNICKNISPTSKPPSCKSTKQRRTNRIPQHTRQARRK